MKLIDLMRQAGVQWPDGAEYAADWREPLTREQWEKRNERTV